VVKLVTNNFSITKELIKEEFSAFEHFEKKFTIYYRNHIRDLPRQLSV
jgi:hypothetical protein